ncbi:hypothetical protein [uncultured Erythrobacter sp.]|uniref:hypothetical protein n=1 Tax=uncultured Erythrobacter sp. TaxID=263913 RepID=UPI00261B2351|nr:hypothetical protein [uncultured Erythrobacter sp.]
MGKGFVGSGKSPKNKFIQPVKSVIGKKNHKQANKLKLAKNHLSTSLLLRLADTPTGRRRYALGQHGGKKSEQKRLKGEHGISVTGDTHESEHTVGFEPLNQTSGDKRGATPRATSLEKNAPAYQEVKHLHRNHIGTGSSNEADGSGMNSSGYRTAQRNAIEASDVSSAVQLNQLAYAFDPNFKTTMQSEEGQAASNSYGQMVASMNDLTYAKFDQNVTVPVDAKQRAEMVLARHAAISGQFPNLELENEVRRHFGVPEYDPDAMDTSD